jgi:hypothetical protein
MALIRPLNTDRGKKRKKKKKKKRWGSVETNQLGN